MKNDRTGARRPEVAIVAPSSASPGGQGVQAHDLSRRFREEGWNVRFVAIDAPLPRWIRRIPYVRTVLNLMLYLPRLARLRGADVAHVYSASYWSFLLAPVPALVACRLFGVRSVLVYHSGEAPDHLENWPGVHRWLRRASHIVVPSAWLQQVFAGHGHRARVIRNVVDPSRFRFRLRRPLRPRLLSTRNLEPYYRVDVTLRAFARVQHEHPDATLTVVGCGSEEAHLRGLVRELGLRGVTFTGARPSRDMPAIYDSADVFVNASIVDNQPVSVLEAFACGLPVVSTGPGELQTMVRHGETGVRVPECSPEAMAAAVVVLLRRPEFAERLARRAREEVERYTWPRVRAQWSAVSFEHPAPVDVEDALASHGEAS
jgi:glycosyltransferase involved in cell wall biosynthesis